MHPGRALFVRQSPQWVGARPPPPEPFRDGEVPPPPPAAPPPRADSHGNRVRLGKKQREKNREAHERHVAAWNAQEERFAAEAREEARADMLAAEALERRAAADMLAAEAREEDLLHVQAMHEKAMAERSQYELDEAADVAAAAAEQADVARPPVPPGRPAGPAGRPAAYITIIYIVIYIYIYILILLNIYLYAVAAIQAESAVTTPQRTEVPMPHAHLLQTVPERFHPEHRTHAQRLRDNAEKRAKRDRSLSPLTYIGPAVDIDLSPFVGRAAGSLVGYAADSIAVEGMPAAYRPPV